MYVCYFLNNDYLITNNGLSLDLDLNHWIRSDLDFLFSGNVAIAALV